MADNKGMDISFPVVKVATEGRSLNLAKGVFAVVDTESRPTKDGYQIVSSFDGMPKDRRIQLQLGKADIGFGRSFSNKSWKSEDFLIKEVEGLYVSAPKDGIETDEVLIGYDGFNADTALSFENGDNDVVSIKMSGEPISLLGYHEPCALAHLRFTAPEEGDKGTDWYDQEIVEKAVEELKRTTLLGGVPITEYLEITPINSENGAATGDDRQFYHLTVEDKGDFTSLGLVQADYADYKVVRTERTEDFSTYTIIAETGLTLPDYVKTLPGLVKGCADCPDGYSELTGGLVYSVSLEDDGADSTSTVEGISTNVVAGTGAKVGQTEGFSTYTVVTTAEITEAELTAFLEANAGSIVQLVAEDVSDYCSPTPPDGIAWTPGDVCKVQQEEYSIIIKDDECGTPRTAEIQAAYPDLTITAGTSNFCQTQYTTNVITNVVCEECSPAFRDLFTSEAPDDFDNKPWVKTPKTYSPTALMGIRFKAKPVILSGSEEYRDDFAQIATSVRLNIAGGYIETVSESFTDGSGDRFAVTVLNVASEPENWGGDLRVYEDISRVYFEGQPRHEGNNYAKFFLGEETTLKGIQPYVDYVLKVRVRKMAQAFSGENIETFYYHMLVEPGKHQDLEGVLNALAVAAGVKPVQAYGTTTPTP